MTTVRIEIHDGELTTTFEQEFPVEQLEEETFAGDVVASEMRPDVTRVATRLAEAAAHAHLRITN